MKILSEITKTIINSLIALYICMAVGYFMKKFNLINDEIIKGFTNLLLKIVS